MENSLNYNYASSLVCIDNELDIHTLAIQNKLKGWVFENVTFFSLGLFNIKNLWQNFASLKKQGQFWNLLVMRIPKLSLHAQFDEILPEKLKV